MRKREKERKKNEKRDNAGTRKKFNIFFKIRYEICETTGSALKRNNDKDGEHLEIKITR